MNLDTSQSMPKIRIDGTSPFHEGEIRVQQQLGIVEKMEVVARRGIRDFMPDQHRTFFAQLPFLIVGSVDVGGQPHASILVNPPGFISSPDNRVLAIKALPHETDPLSTTLSAGASLGLLGIELHTRRRNRANGRVGHLQEDGFLFHLEQSFGNCPKYIQARMPVFGESGAAMLAAPRLRRSSRLEPAMRGIIRQADTFFIATAHPAAQVGENGCYGVDVSHRGGKPGFVDIDEASILTVPDYQGNFFFNTLGNLVLNPRAGLLFIDFEGGDLLYLSVTAEIIWSGPRIENYAKAQRLLRLSVTEALHLEAALPWHWSEAQLSPYLTG